MSLKEKATLWTLIVTVMAHFESSCSPEAKNKGPNGMALGLLQLHSGKEDKYDGEFNTCDKNASSSTSGTLKCALGMLETQLERTNGNLFDPKSYWDVLRPRGRARKADDIQRAIQGSSLCNPKGI